MRNAGDVFIHTACHKEDVKDVFTSSQIGCMIAFHHWHKFCKNLEMLWPAYRLHSYNGILTWKHIFIDKRDKLIRSLMM